MKNRHIKKTLSFTACPYYGSCVYKFLNSNPAKAAGCSLFGVLGILRNLERAYFKALPPPRQLGESKT